jgi:lysophospholipase L1-like esterase
MRIYGHERRSWRSGAPWKTIVVAALAVAPTLGAQQPAGATPAERARADSALAAMRQATAEDHRQMLAQLGITALRPGPSGNESAPNHANYDSTLANPFTSLPDVLRMNDGRRVTNARLWQQRRRELIDGFEREVYGRMPAHVPKVTWTVTSTDTGRIGGRRVVAKQLVGHAANSADPSRGNPQDAPRSSLTVDIPLTVVVPEDAKGRVPLMIMFRPGTLESALGRPPLPGARPQGFVPPPPAPGSDASATEQLIVDGWGFAFLNPTSVQADNGAGLTQGIIGLANHGKRRKPDDWGALRAWAWGASRALDYLETDQAVDASRVGIEGVSRYGKAALVTMAFDPRFAIVLIGSSGKGGTTLHRRNWGEAVESLAGSGEYHWMAGNYLKYAADSSRTGRHTANELPVDSHELIALCAPRLTFVSYGVPEKGDAKWLDQQGSFMATVAAQPVFRLLGAKDLGVPDDWRTAKMPPVNVGLLDGELAWRQHDGGHTDAPNWKYFLQWADGKFDRTYTAAPPVPASSTSAVTSAGSATASAAPWPADKPTPRTDANSKLAHEQLLAKRTQGKIDVYFEGNSITRRWGATDYPQFLANWRANFTGWNAADFGWGADRIEHILWRLENGELDGVNPKVIVILAGTNNVGKVPGGDAKVADITRGLRALVDLCRSKAPSATIVLTGIFPRNDDTTTAREINAEIARINENLARMADGKSIRYVNVNDKLADATGTLRAGMMVDGLHPTLQGYQIWADVLKPILNDILGPPKATDEAPPATGDPSAAKRG